jgi:hypothetical protein
MANFGPIFSTTIYQVAMGATLGASMDALFGSVEEVNGSTLLRSSLELVGQLTANSLLVILAMDYGRRKNFILNPDPTMGLPFFFGIYSSQPRLQAKLKNTVSYIRRRVDSFVVDVSPTGPSPALTDPTYVAPNPTISEGTTFADTDMSAL